MPSSRYNAKTKATEVKLTVTELACVEKFAAIADFVARNSDDKDAAQAAAWAKKYAAVAE